ncbi:hypothetical protein [Streptomyces beijiangensis]|uniref:Uncharacterized protein n=1 Tax=Streptomyces beijiangensis TaxID=163361 RepID=A0A939FCF6_9ACTN|nr:hypothetical protein [Streptomyces beijiangensis]MBO0515759.1 hypothetical protein [Streptomyces beijiangensis]
MYRVRPLQARWAVSDWEGHVEEPLSFQHFDRIWPEARQHITTPEA